MDSGTNRSSLKPQKATNSAGLVCNSATEGKNGELPLPTIQGTGGDHELTNSLVIADYFFQEKFFVGAGLASMQLTNSSSGSSISASATSPVLQVGYTENLTKNLQLSIGVLQYSSGLSLSSTTPSTHYPQQLLADSFNTEHKL